MTYEELLADVERWIERLDASVERIEAMIKRAELLLAPRSVVSGGSISSIDLDQRINIEQFLRLLPPHKCELTIGYNPHKSYYLTVAEYLESVDEDTDEWASPSDREAAITNNELWIVQWYPDTPVGSYQVFGSTLEACLRKISETDYT